MTPPSQAATGQTIILTHPREPGKFSGTDDVDVEDWILMYERVSSHNRWDPTIMLANLDLYLKGAAKDWFDTNEARLTSWDACKEELKALFGRSESRQLEAKNDLASRVQSPTESYVTYIQSVLSLCYKVDRQMSEEEKVGHVLKGIADDAFNLLVFKNCDKVDTLIAECRRFELAKSRRIAQKFTRLPNTAATSSCEDNLQPPAGQRTSTGMPPTPDNITRIVRREIEAIAPTCFSHDAQTSSAVPVPLIQAVVREELLNLGVQPICSVSHPCARYRSPISPSRRDNMPQRFQSRLADEWRTPDDRPICFNCRRVGQVARYCRSRPFPPHQNNFYQYPDDPPRRFYSRRQPQPDTADSDDNRWSGRSPSPQRHQSRSPRRFSSPTPPTSYSRPSQEN
ncbi:uncharacterized protein LOC144148230 [Haemaphysalis longicornis]